MFGRDFGIARFELPDSESPYFWFRVADSVPLSCQITECSTSKGFRALGRHWNDLFCSWLVVQDAVAPLWHSLDRRQNTLITRNEQSAKHVVLASWPQGGVCGGRWADKGHNPIASCQSGCHCCCSSRLAAAVADAVAVAVVVAATAAAAAAAAATAAVAAAAAAVAAAAATAVAAAVAAAAFAAAIAAAAAAAAASAAVIATTTVAAAPCPVDNRRACCLMASSCSQ